MEAAAPNASEEKSDAKALEPHKHEGSHDSHEGHKHPHD